MHAKLSQLAGPGQAGRFASGRFSWIGMLDVRLDVKQFWLDYSREKVDVGRSEAAHRAVHVVRGE